MLSCRPDDAVSATRFARHLVLSEIGVEGQAKLARGSALIVGLGGLGSPAALYLAAAGVGRLGLVDDDKVEPSNLQRQILHGEPDLGTAKIDSAVKKIRAANSNVYIEAFSTRLDGKNAAGIVGEYDIVLGCVDNFETRYHLNSACVARRKPNVFGAASGFSGQAAVFSAEGKPCYQCFFREAPPAERTVPEEESGVVGYLPGIIGCLQAGEAVKIILGIGQPLYARLLLFDALATSFREITLRPNPDCPVCSDGTGASN